MSKKTSKKVREEELNELLVGEWHMKFKQAMIAKQDYTKRWLTYFDAYNGDYFKDDKRPEYKSNQISNYIFSIIETIRPIMLDNNPKFQALPRKPEGMAKANDVQFVFDYEWDREEMNLKLYRELINTLVIGNSVLFLPWDSDDENVKGIPVNPFNIFPDPLATSIDDSEYIIYATYKHENKLKKMFPEYKDKFIGGDINYSELVYENDKPATNITNQILTLEVWCRDWTTVEVEEYGLVKKKLKYPKGRIITMCPELGLLLSDKHNPYKDKRFPFEIIKDYDIPGKFWGEGEVKQLLSPQEYMNDLSNQIIDNARATANMPWIIDKNSGIGHGKITNRPGIVIRKNPGSEVKRDAPPPMPNYITDKVMEFKDDMEQISGIFSSVKGGREQGVYTAQGILALQEAGQARVRLKVKLLEEALGNIATKWYSRIQQYWKEERFVRVSNADGSYDFKQITPEDLKEDYDIKITAGSTMPVNRSAMLDLMIRLAQTPAEDGLPMVDREAVLEYIPNSERRSILERMDSTKQMMEKQQQEQEMQAQQEEQVVSAIEQITQMVEQLGGKIGQLENEHAKIKEEEKTNQIKDQAYNEGYKEAEKIAQEEMSMQEGQTAGGLATSPMAEEGMPGEIPEELLMGLENLNDDELAIMLQKYPELTDIINSL